MTSTIATGSTPFSECRSLSQFVITFTDNQPLWSRGSRYQLTLGERRGALWTGRQSQGQHTGTTFHTPGQCKSDLICMCLDHGRMWKDLQALGEHAKALADQNLLALRQQCRPMHHHGAQVSLYNVSNPAKKTIDTFPIERR